MRCGCFLRFKASGTRFCSQKKASPQRRTPRPKQPSHTVPLHIDCPSPLPPPSLPAPPLQPPKLLVVFVVGGTTYEEAKVVADLNAAGERGEGWSAGMRLVLGGTGVQSSGSFLKDFQEVMVNERYHGG